MSTLLELIGTAKTAVLAGFDPEFEYLGYTIEVVGAFVLEDEKLWGEFDANCTRELAACPAHSHPQDVFDATLASLSEIEKGAIRRRALAAMEKWNNA